MHAMSFGKGKGKIIKMDHEFMKKITPNCEGALDQNYFY